MTSIVCSLDHPIIFIFDFQFDEVKVPEYDEDKVVSNNDNCVSVRAISYIDGEVKVGLNETISGIDMMEVFTGVITTPNKSVAIVNSNNEILLESKVLGEKTGIRILVNSKNFPDCIDIETFNP